MNRQNKTVVIGAGIAGLTTAALLLEAGHEVTVLEAQAYPGGCAGTFFYQNYRFDAGATLAGGFAPGGPHHQVAQRLGLEWPTAPVTPIAWTVHLPDGRSVSQWTDMERWREARQRAFPTAERFWHKQEQLADIAWDVSTRHFPWPPQDARDLLDLGLALRPKTFLSTPYILRSIGSFMPKNDPMLRTFVDANLLISAQATADKANALYGSAALELPRRGVSHVTGGVGGIADTLVEWIRSKGGSIFFKQSVDQIEVRNGKAVAVHTNQSKRQSKRLTVECDTLIGNLTPWGLQKLLATDAPPKLAAETVKRGSTWGAFMLYIGLDESKLPVDLVEHHQVVRDHTKPLGETNSIFISISPAGESERAPNGMRAANISTHTKIEPWWALRDDPQGEQAYLERRERYVEAMLNSAEIAIPGFKQAAKMILPATPVTYEHWTGRPLGMVGGFPQTSILDARGPQTSLANCWLVGDSVFPGQSTAGVTLSALRVAEKVRQRTL
ncbi:MAG: FAD-dependent oxidoreductase [Candidatus Promineifilaceae bacterium]